MEKRKIPICRNKVSLLKIIESYSKVEKERKTEIHHTIPGMREEYVQQIELSIGEVEQIQDNYRGLVKSLRVHANICGGVADLSDNKAGYGDDRYYAVTFYSEFLRVGQMRIVEFEKESKE